MNISKGRGRGRSWCIVCGAGKDEPVFNFPRGEMMEDLTHEEADRAYRDFPVRADAHWKYGSNHPNDPNLLYLQGYYQGLYNDNWHTVGSPSLDNPIYKLGCEDGQGDATI